MSKKIGTVLAVLFLLAALAWWTWSQCELTAMRHRIAESFGVPTSYVTPRFQPVWGKLIVGSGGDSSMGTVHIASGLLPRGRIQWISLSDETLRRRYAVDDPADPQQYCEVAKQAVVGLLGVKPECVRCVDQMTREGGTVVDLSLCCQHRWLFPAYFVRIGPEGTVSVIWWGESVGRGHRRHAGCQCLACSAFMCQLWIDGLGAQVRVSFSGLTQRPVSRSMASV